MRLLQRPQKKQLSCKKFSSVAKSVCHLCPAGCGLKIFLDDARPADIYGDESHPANKGALCPKAMALYWQFGHSTRLAHPAIRRSTDDPWQETGWDTALAFAAEQIQNAGPDNVIVGAKESDPFDAICGAELFAEALNLKVMPSQFFPGSFGSAGAFKKMTGIPARQFLANTPRDWCASKAILVIGGDLAQENPITFGPLQDARDRGTKLFYLGSRGGMTARKASDAWIVRSGTEALALAAVIHVFLRDGLVDQTFIDADTKGFEAFREKAGAYAPEAVAEVCGLSAERIEELARLLSTIDPIQIVTGQIDIRRWTDDAFLSMGIGLTVIKGALGRPGCGFNILGTTPFGWSDKTPVCLEQRLLELSPTVFMAYGDPLSQLAGHKSREVLRHVKCVIHVGPYDNETRRIALVSLPACHWLEYNSLTHLSNGRALQWSEAAVAPYGESREPSEIFAGLTAMLASKDGAEAAILPDGKRLAEARLSGCDLTAGISIEDMIGSEDPGGILWPCSSEASGMEKSYENTRYIRGNVRGKNNILFTPYSRWTGTDKKYPTGDGRIHLEHAAWPVLDISPAGQDELALIIADPVDRTADNPQAMLWPNGVDLGKAARLHPMTAAQLGVRNRSRVRLDSSFGSVQATAVICPDIPEHSVVLSSDIGLELVGPAAVLKPVTVSLARI